MISNLSENVNPSNCIKCGAACCKHYEIWYDDTYGKIYLSEMQRLQTLKNIGKYIEIVRDNSRGGYWLRFNDVCEYLDANNRCEIYELENRPLLCRLFPSPSNTKEDCQYIRNQLKRPKEPLDRDYYQFIDYFIDEINTRALRKYNDFGVNL